MLLTPLHIKHQISQMIYFNNKHGHLQQRIIGREVIQHHHVYKASSAYFIIVIIFNWMISNKSKENQFHISEIEQLPRYSQNNNNNNNSVNNFNACFVLRTNAMALLWTVAMQTFVFCVPLKYTAPKACAIYVVKKYLK